MIETRRFLDDEFSNLVDALEVTRSLSEMRATLREFARRCDFDMFSCVQIQSSTVRLFSSYPSEWQDRYTSAGYASIDPVVSAAKKSTQPFIWSMVDTVERDESIRRFTEEAIYFGIRCGFTVPLHVGFGGTTALSLTSAKPQSPPIEFRDFGPALTAAAFAHINLLRLTERIEEGIAAKLSPRETICLKWAALGMTKKDTAAIIGLSEKTVRFYLDNVMKKLAARNITQAVAIATDKYLI